MTAENNSAEGRWSAPAWAEAASANSHPVPSHLTAPAVPQAASNADATVADAPAAQGPTARVSTPAGDARSLGVAAANGGRIRLSSSDLKSSYCNFFNGNSTREEVVLNFGVSHNWDRGAAERQVDMLHRIILSPYAAKRVSEALRSLLSDYETRHGELK